MTVLAVKLVALMPTRSLLTFSGETSSATDSQAPTAEPFVVENRALLTRTNLGVLMRTFEGLVQLGKRFLTPRSSLSLSKQCRIKLPRFAVWQVAPF